MWSPNFRLKFLDWGLSDCGLILSCNWGQREPVTDWFLLMHHVVQDWFHHSGWPPAATHQYNTSVSPPWVCLWFGVVQKYGCLCSVQNMGFPTVETQQHVCKSCFVSAVELSERLSCWLWCDSHRTCIWTTPTLDDKQMIQETVFPFFSWSLPPWPADVSWRPDDAGHTAGG